MILALMNRDEDNRRECAILKKNAPSNSKAIPSMGNVECPFKRRFRFENGIFLLL